MLVEQPASDEERLALAQRFVAAFDFQVQCLLCLHIYVYLHVYAGARSRRQAAPAITPLQWRGEYSTSGVLLPTCT